MIVFDGFPNPEQTVPIFYSYLRSILWVRLAF